MNEAEVRSLMLDAATAMEELRNKHAEAYRVLIPYDAFDVLPAFDVTRQVDIERRLRAAAGDGKEQG